MNQDQDFNQNDSRDDRRSERGPRPQGRRDDDRQRDSSRSDNDRRDSRPTNFNRRDEGGQNNDRRPFNRDNNRPTDSRRDARHRDAGRSPSKRQNEGGRDNDRRPFNRDNDRRDAGRRDIGSSAPRREGNTFGRDFNNERDDFRRNNSRPPFTRDRREAGPRDDDQKDNQSRGYNRRDGESPRPERSNDRREGNFNRSSDRREGNRPDAERRGAGNRFGNERRFDDRKGDDRRDSRPNRFGDKGGFDRRESRGDAPRNNDRFGDKPRFDRDAPRDRQDDRFERKPRFERDNDRPNTSRSEDNRAERKPRFEREGDRREGNRFEGKPRFERDNDRANREDRSERKPRFEREGDSERRQERSKEEGGFRPRDNEFDKRFTKEQRDDSRDRRVGNFKQAPDYNSPKFAKPGFGKPGKKYADKPVPKAREEEQDQRQKTTPDPSSTELIRLNRYIANAGVCSRREADELISKGDITVNGKVVTEMGYKVQPTDIVKYGNNRLNPEKLVYILLNKPKDFITTTEDPEERKTVMELVADAGNFRIYPVGRLDRNTTGLLLMTNDGELADKLTHPSNNIRKIYQAELDKPITEEHFEAIREGIELEDGVIKPDDLALVTPDAQVVGIEIHSGRNRIVRRIFEHFGYEVTKLDRTVYASLTKKELPRGKWRFLEPKEVIKLKYLN